jgi:shikimate kinase
MMGSGKSTVGPLLAERLGRPFLDTDAAVEAAAGMSVPQIFAEEGEARFRARERAAIEAASGQGAVVALGGGAVAQPGVLELLRQSGTLVYLRAGVETLLARVGRGVGRPLLEAADDPAAALESLLEARRARYESADFVVDTDGRSPDEVAVELARLLAEKRS